MNVLKSIVPVFLSAAMTVQLVPAFTAHGEVIADDMSEARIGDLTFRYVPDMPRKGECTLASASDSSDKLTIAKHAALEIPEKLGGYTVTALGADSEPIALNSEDEKVSLTTIKLPHSIREIHPYALNFFNFRRSRFTLSRPPDFIIFPVQLNL